MIRRTLLAFAAVLIALPTAAQDNWPSRPVKIVSPFPAGGTIGTLRAAKMLPDGYTIVQTGVGQNAVAHGLDPRPLGRGCCGRCGSCEAQWSQ